MLHLLKGSRKRRCVAQPWRDDLAGAQRAFAGLDHDAYARTPEEVADIVDAWRDGRESGSPKERLQGAQSAVDILSRILGGVMNALGFFINVVWRSGTARQSIFFSDNEDAMFSSGAMTPTLLAPQLDMSVPTQPMWVKAQQQVDSLKQIDPDFNQIAFLDYAAKAWTQAQTAEGAMDASGASGVVTPAYAANLKSRIDDWKNEGFRRVVSGLKLDGTTLYKVSLDGVSQSLVVRVAGSGVRYTQDTATGSSADGSVKNETFTEFATFVRPTGTVTPKTAQLGGSTHCPSCGAPAPMLATKCEFCNTPLTPAGAPWLLDHVSQSAYT
jgi:hypothetical protein